MFPLIWIVSVCSILNGCLVLAADEKSQKIVIVGAGASGMSAATKLIENGYDNIVVLEAENRIGGRIHSIPFGSGYIDLGAQWCQGETGNVVYEMLKNVFEFGDTDLRPDNCHIYTSDGHSVDQKKFAKLMDATDSILSDYDNMGKFNESLGEFFETSFRSRIQDSEFKDVEKELADQVIDFRHRAINTLYASDTSLDISSQLNAFPDAEGNQVMTWKEHGYKILFDYLTKKLPDPTKALPVDDKIQFNKEVTNVDWSSNEVVVTCADGTQYRADHVIVTVSLGFLKKNHRTLFTPQLPAKKVNAIENTGYGTLGKIFLEFEDPFWPTDVNNWASYVFLWKQEDKDKLIGTEREWLLGVTSFIREDFQPNLIGGLTAGKHIKQFEELSDKQLIDDCMWLLEKFLGKTLPRPKDMRRNRWMSNKYFLGTYSYASMDSQIHNVKVGIDLGETLYTQEDKKPILLIAGEATDEDHSGYVHGAVASGWRAANEILDFYK